MATNFECWMLKELGTNKTLVFTDKHVALESLELTYAAEVSDNQFTVKWPSPRMGLVEVNGRSLYSLINSKIEIIGVAKVIDRHPDGPRPTLKSSSLAEMIADYKPNYTE